MRMKPFGVSPPERPTPVPEPPPDTGPATEYAVVAARDPDGLPSRLILPGPIAGQEVALYVDVPGSRRVQWAARVLADGTVGLGNDAGDALASVRPGTKIVAACDSAGRVLALTAVCKPKRRSAATERVTTRAADDLEHRPHELLYSGAAGKVLKVS
jgi:hypothetical protein